METYSGAITVYIPQMNDPGSTYVSGSTSIRQAFINVSDHDHTGSGKGNPLGTTAIQDAAITNAKIAVGTITSDRLAAAASVGVIANNSYLKWRNQANLADLSVIKVNTSNILEFNLAISKLQMANDVYNTYTNFANTGTINGFKVNSSDQLTAGNTLYIQHLIGQADNTYDLGSSSVKMRRVYLNNIRFGSSSTDLSVYESSTWTPVVAGKTSAGTGTYTVQTGEYVRIGNTVKVTCTLTFTGHTGTGSVTITGLPYAAKSTTAIFVGSMLIDTATFSYGTTTGIVPTIAGGNQYIELFQQALAGGAATTTIGMGASGTLKVSIEYKV